MATGIGVPIHAEIGMDAEIMAPARVGDFSPGTTFVAAAVPRGRALTGWARRPHRSWRLRRLVGLWRLTIPIGRTSAGSISLRLRHDLSD